MLGGLLFQYPLGRLSDKVDRRYMLILGSIGSIAVCMFIGLGNIVDPYFLIFMVVVLGGLVQPLYSIAAAHAFDFASPDDMVETAAGVLLAYGTGSIIGPTVATTAMDIVGPGALFLSVACSLAGLVLFLMFRITRRVTLSTEDKGDYDLASSAPIGGVLTPELYEVEDEWVLVPEDYEMEETGDDEETTTEYPYSDLEEDEGTP